MGFEKEITNLQNKLRIALAEKAVLMIEKPKRDAFVQVDDVHAEENIYTSILEFLNNKDMWNFMIPRMREEYMEALMVKRQPDASDIVD